MANRYANLVGANKIKDEYIKINTGFDKVEQDIDAEIAARQQGYADLVADLAQEISEREAGDNYLDGRINTIIGGSSPDKDPELTDIRTPDSSYTPGRTINVAGDITRDMQAQFAAHKADIAPYINPQFFNSNRTLYVDGTSGSDSNDGITSGTAKKTIQAALNMIPVDYLGNITIDIAAGTYNENLRFWRKLSVGTVTFQGKKDGSNIPTVIIEGTGLGNVDGVSIQNGYVVVNDIKVQNFPFDGIRCDFSPFVGLNNVHTFNCGSAGYEGVRSSRSAVQLNNCLIDGNNAGTNGVIAYNGFLSILNSVVKNVTGYGVYYSAGGWGHCDYNTIENCSRGLVARFGANPISQGNTIKDCSYGIFSEAAFVYYDTTTFTNCTTNVEQQTLLGLGGRLYDQSNRTLLRAKGDAFDIITEGAGAFLGQFVTAGFALPGGGWNSKHFILGTYHIWVDSTGKLRIKNGAPSSDTDGTVVGTQT